MDIPERSLILTKAEAATRQVEGAIEALVRGHFDIAITLAGAAEDMIDSPDSLFAYHRDHLNAKELGELEDKLVPHLNRERNWLKHASGLEPMQFGHYSAAFMVARAVTKLKPESCTTPITAFCHWWTENIDSITQ